MQSGVVRRRRGRGRPSSPPGVETSTARFERLRGLLERILLLLVGKAPSSGPANAVKDGRRRSGRRGSRGRATQHLAAAAPEPRTKTSPNLVRAVFLLSHPACREFVWTSVRAMCGPPSETCYTTAGGFRSAAGIAIAYPPCQQGRQGGGASNQPTPPADVASDPRRRGLLDGGPQVWVHPLHFSSSRINPSSSFAKETVWTADAGAMVRIYGKRVQLSD